MSQDHNNFAPSFACLMPVPIVERDLSAARENAAYGRVKSRSGHLNIALPPSVFPSPTAVPRLPAPWKVHRTEGGLPVEDDAGDALACGRGRQWDWN
jgi:hypothetical protein